VLTYSAGSVIERSTSLSTPTADFDSPWKEALETYLRDFLTLCFPQLAAGIDWGRPPEFLENELRQVTREAELGPRRVDLLVQVGLLDGRETWLLIHIEVQGQEEALFSQRMFVYFYRLFDHYRRPLVSLAVLTDERATWRPATFALEQWGCTLHFSYPIVKLADWRGRQAELAASANPFATVLLAHLAAQATRGDAQARWGAKLALIRGLFDRGLAREQVLSLFRIIDWFLALPQDREQALWTAVRALEEEHKMPYVTSIERFGRAEGLKEGLERGREEGQAEERRALVRRAVLRRFGSIPAALEERLTAADLDELTALFDQVLVAPDLEAL
jgi:hypothetical protein